MIEEFVKGFVASRGYGPWYQQQAWEYVRRMSADVPNALVKVYEYLDGRYPFIVKGSE